MALSIALQENRKACLVFMAYGGWKYFLEVEFVWVMIDFNGVKEIMWTKPNTAESVYKV